MTKVTTKQKKRRDYENRFKSIGPERMGAPVAVCLPVEVDRWLRALPNRSEWLRRVICEAVAKEQEKSGN